MRCTDPRTVGFHPDGKTICWSPKKYSKEYATFQLPCGQCLECRLEYARQWAVRCVHEAKMHEKNCFITLTYADEHLKSPKLDYSDFQKFAKKLREKIFCDFVAEKFGTSSYYKKLSKQQKTIFRMEHSDVLEKLKISIFVTGEYGDINKRPHWHACIFNYRPSDGIPKYTNDRGDQVYESAELSGLWQNGIADFGAVTFESAGYVARYAAKKLVHGNDQDHDFQPISKKSSHQAIGKKFLEKYWEDVFNEGIIILSDGSSCAVPRYYEKWLQKNKPDEWRRYVTQTKNDKITKASSQRDAELLSEQKIRDARVARGNYSPQITKNQMRSKIAQSKFKLLQSRRNLKGE